MMYITVFDLIVPLQIINIIHTLKIHRNSFQTVCQFDGNGVQFNTTGHLEIGKLGDLHSIQPDFPAQTGSAQGGRFPIIFHKTDIMIEGIDAQYFHALKVLFLNIKRRRFQNDLILVVMLQPVGIITVTTVSRPPGRLNISNIPGLRTQRF